MARAQFPLDRELTAPMTVTLVITLVAGCATTVSSLLALPIAGPVASVFLAGVVTFGVLTFRQSRRREIPFLRALGDAVRRFFRLLLDLLPL